MVYLLDLSHQTRLFLLSLGLGFAFGLLYDVFRVVRLIIAPKRTGAYLLVQDILYSIVCTVFSFYFFLAIEDGMLRGYCILGMILGWLVYYFSLGAVALRASEWIVRTLRRFCAKMTHLVARPLLWIWRGVKKCMAVMRKMRISTKFAKKNLHLHLHSTPQMVYNGRATAFTEKKERRFATQTPKANFISKRRRAPGPKVGRAEKPRGEFFGAHRGAGVRALGGVSDFKQPRNHRRRGHAKRKAAATNLPVGGGQPGIPGSAQQRRP